MGQLLLFLFLLVSLTSCSTTPVRLADSSPVMVKRLSPEFAKYSSPAPNIGKVIVIRDRGLTGGAGLAEFYLDGKRMATLTTIEALILYLPKGEYDLVVTPETGSPSTQPGYRTAHLLVEPEKEYYFRISVSLLRRLALEPTVPME